MFIFNTADPKPVRATSQIQKNSINTLWFMLEEVFRTEKIVKKHSNHKGTTVTSEHAKRRRWFLSFQLVNWDEKLVEIFCSLERNACAGTQNASPGLNRFFWISKSCKISMQHPFFG
jgi:hypothetical protein